jgi:ketosteroid isomerase-like protein
MILTLAAAVAASSLASTPAAASEETAVMATVRQFDASFNKGDAAQANGLCAPHAIIIDDFAPHVWQGGAACADWWKAIGAFDAKNAITASVVTLGKPWHVVVTGDRAYVVEPVTFTYKQHGKPVVESGSVWTLALLKSGARWRISGWAWTQH